MGQGAGQDSGNGTGHGTQNSSVIERFGMPDGPRFLNRELPQYPLLARRRKQEGRVVLSISIGENGCVTGIEVMEASNPIFIGPSVEAVKKSSFAPAMRNGVPVASKALLPIRFTLNREVLEDQT